MLGKKESQKKLTDKILEKFYDGVFEAVDDMRFYAEMSKKEITSILIRNLKMGINESFDMQSFEVESND